MREIKFRALVPVNTDEPKRMMYYDLVNIDDLNRLASEDWDINQLMQFTGLKDKNGTPIYEGDIFKRIVKINNALHGNFAFYQFKIKNGNTVISYLRSEKDTGIPEGYMAAPYTDEFDVDMETIMFAKEVTLHECEIIGNIYENKDLL